MAEGDNDGIAQQGTARALAEPTRHSAVLDTECLSELLHAVCQLVLWSFVAGGPSNTKEQQCQRTILLYLYLAWFLTFFLFICFNEGYVCAANNNN